DVYKRQVHGRETEADALDADDSLPFHEGDALRAVTDALPDPATLFVSNSMPVRDLDRFVEPTTTSVTALGNRGVSGIDGIVSSALGAGSATTDDLTLVVGDLALYHDSNGLLALDRCDVDATVVLINNDGGGIFHKLPIESFEPEFTESFKTPHGIEFEPLADLHGLAYARIDARPGPGESAAGAVADLTEAYRRAREANGSHLIEVRTDAESSHRTRERLEAAVERAVHGEVAGDGGDA
ncbi:2-succinyl-6-hydroxy-2,4-cyclohexadiene-1-carboxylate synthase, partial [Halorubrum saccharovorum DSM 1137]